jgi:hypothetical protein
VIELHSGATGLLLRTAPNPIPNAKPSGGSSQMRHHLRGGADVDGDGVIDLVVRTVRREQINIVDVISGKSRDVIAQLTAHPDPNGREEWWFPSEIAVADDFDGDGLRDVLLGHDEVGTEQGLDYGAIYLHSTRTNQRLMAVWGDTDDVKLGGAIAWLGDTDGDGLPEFAALSTRGIRVWAIEREDAK